MNYLAIARPVEVTPFNSPLLPDVRQSTGRGAFCQYSKAEQKRIIEHGLVHRIKPKALAEFFNVSEPTIYNWKRDYLIGMYADEVIYNQTIAFRRGK